MLTPRTKKLNISKKDTQDPEALFIYLKYLTRELVKLYDDITKAFLFNKDLVGEDLNAEATWNPGSIANGAEEAKDVTLTGVALGDFAIASFSLDINDLTLDVQVTAADTVTCVLANNTGGAVDLASGTVYVRAFKRLPL